MKLINWMVHQSKIASDLDMAIASDHLVLLLEGPHVCDGMEICRTKGFNIAPLIKLNMKSFSFI